MLAAVSSFLVLFPPEKKTMSINRVLVFATFLCHVEIYIKQNPANASPLIRVSQCSYRHVHYVEQCVYIYLCVYGIGITIDAFHCYYLLKSFNFFLVKFTTKVFFSIVVLKQSIVSLHFAVLFERVQTARATIRTQLQR